MGQEIDSSRFTHKEFHRFDLALQEEMTILSRLFAEGRFADGNRVGGFELELWLVDKQGQPAPLNHRYLPLAEAEQLPMVAELARFNVELNSEPHPLHGRVLRQMHAELERSWHRSTAVARQMDLELAMIGILPTVQESQLILANMSEVTRYRALNEQVQRLRHGQMLHLDIAGRQHLQATHHDVMFESAATSFQLHLQLEPQSAARYYNATHILSAPMVAIAANSPYLFGYDLWDESRIPLFEQAVAVGAAEGMERVTFGSGYVESSLFECFLHNQRHYPVLLPALSSEPSHLLPHLRLHNGTIWRWNRPLIGFDAAGEPHLRLEHRVMAAGPSCVDAIANAALFFGAVERLAKAELVAEKKLCFGTARANFYAAAKNGLNAKIVWLDGKEIVMRDLLQQQILPMARRGLELLEVDGDDADHYLGVIAGRLSNRQNGAAWQRAWVAKHGADMSALMQAYLERQQQGAPVHEWSV